MVHAVNEGGLERRAARAAGRRRYALALTLAGAVAYADDFPAELDLASLQPQNGGDGSEGVIFQAFTPFDLSGTTVAAGGDVDGDGFDDLLTGAPGEGPCLGCAGYLVLGREQFAATFDLVLELVRANGREGFVIQASESANAAGTSVHSAGDLNADGYDDVIVGAPAADPHGVGGAGEAYLLFGRRTGFLAFFDVDVLRPANGGDGSEGFIAIGALSGESAGHSVSGGCDVNGDGLADAVIGAPDAAAGRVHVIFGRDSGFPPEFELADLLPENGGDGSAGFTLLGIDAGDEAGWSVSCLGDVNGDGRGDLAIGAPFADPFGLSAAGELYLVFGRSGFPPAFELASLLPAGGGDGSEGVVFLGMAAGDTAGFSVGAAGDINADDLTDVFTGAPDADPNGRGSAGRALVVFGRGTGFAAEFPLAQLLPQIGGDGSLGFVLNGEAIADEAGTSVGTAGDVNGDGIDDLAVGAPLADPPLRLTGGMAYVLFGRDTGFAAEIELSSLRAGGGGDGSDGFVLLGTEAGDHAGAAVGAAGDVDGDGVADLLLGASQASQTGFFQAGETYLVFGRATDSDGDGVPQIADNCSQVANADQRDSNDDGIGNVCDGDLNDDCIVNFADVGLLKAVFFGNDADADLNGDGSVNFADLGLMQLRFFQAPGPSGIPNDCAN